MQDIQIIHDKYATPNSEDAKVGVTCTGHRRLLLMSLCVVGARTEALRSCAASALCRIARRCPDPMLPLLASQRSILHLVCASFISNDIALHPL